MTIYNDQFGSGVNDTAFWCRHRGYEWNGWGISYAGEGRVHPAVIDDFGTLATTTWSAAS